MEKIKNYISGILTTPYNSNYINNCNPATGDVYTMTPDSNKEDVLLAVQSAEKAMPNWYNISAENRRNMMFWIAEKMRENFDSLALAESNDTGKPLWLVKSIDIPGAINNIEYFASHTDSFMGRSQSETTGVMSSWNMPLFLLTWKIAPALSAGNCVIANPSLQAPMTAYLFSQLCIEAGMPDGVLSIIHGYADKVEQAIMEFPNIKTLSFNGSSQRGFELEKVSVEKKTFLELGGKNPAVIFNDCNYDRMLDAIIYSSFSNQGENCLGASRLFVEKNMYDKFKKDLIVKSEKLKIGDPLELETHIGAIISQELLKKISSHIESVKKDGGNILCGGSETEGSSTRTANGLFFKPTVIDNLDVSCETFKEDIYGPVVVLIPFEKEEDATEMANDSANGFSSIIWTEDMKRAERIASKIDTRIVWINSWMLKNIRIPYDGIKGLNLESGALKALRFYNQ